jgi:glycerol kinase
MAETGEICFGMVDSFLISRLTDGPVHATDFTSASRAMLFDINKGCWGDELLKLLKIPRDILPEAEPSAHLFGEIDPEHIGKRLPIASALEINKPLFLASSNEDSQKNTYGIVSSLSTILSVKEVSNPVRAPPS